MGIVSYFYWKSENVPPVIQIQEKIVNQDNPSQNKLSENWKFHFDNRLAFQVKIPQDAETQVVPAGFDNEMGFGPEGISRMEFSNKDFLIKVEPSTNRRNDQTLQQLGETREFNGLPGTSHPSPCSKGAEKEEIQLRSGTKAFLCDSVLPSGRKFGMAATILGKKYFYNITTGSIYSPNFTDKEQEIFMEFLNTFQPTD